MPKVTLSNLSSTKASSIIATINANNTAIVEAFENTLSRDGSAPNTIETDLDLNSKRILNLPAPVSGSEPIRKAEFDAEIEALDSAVDSAVNAAAAANTALDLFTDIWLGAWPADPTTDNDGNPLQGGAVYYNTGLGHLRIFKDSVWVDAVLTDTGGSGGGTELFVQQTQPSETGPWIWFETDGSGIFLDFVVNDGTP